MEEQTGTPSGTSPPQLSRRAGLSILAFALVALVLVFCWTVYNEDRDLRVHFLEDARMVSSTINWRQIVNLTASEADLGDPGYRRIKEQLAGIHQASPRNHFVYLLKQRADGAIVILADSEPATSGEYSPPGQEYREATPEIGQVFASDQESTVGPYRDRWGRWVSAIVPIADPETGTTVALMGLDIAARDWYRDLARETAESLALILVLVVPLAVYVTLNRRSEQSLKRSRDEWQNTFDCMPDLIAILDTQHRIVRANRAMRQKLEQDGSIIGRHCYRHVHKQDAPPDFCPHARLLKDGAPHVEEAHLPELDGDYSVTVTPLHDAAGNLTGSIHIARNITEKRLAEDALRESEALLRDAQLMAGLGTYRLDIGTGTWSCSAVMDEIFGIDENYDHSVSGWAALVHPDDQNMMTRYFAGEVVGNGQFFNKEYRIVRHADGGERWVHGMGRLEFDDQGQPVRMIGTILDITEQKQQEHMLRHASDEWRRTFDTIPDLITIVDSEHRIVRANRATWQKLGCDIHDLLHKPCYTVFHGSDSPPEHCPHRHLMQDGLAHSVEIFEPRLNCHLDVTVTPLCDPDGKVTGSIHVAHDITGLKRAGEALQKSEQLYRSILTASPDTIAITDLERVIRMVSPAGLAMFGYGSNEELQGRAIVNFLVPEDRERARANIRLMFQGSLTGPDEYRVLRADGSSVMVEVNSDFIVGSDGRPESMIFVIRDISERKRVEVELNRKNAEIEQFIYTVSHDLRSPLVTIKTFLGYLGQDISTGDSNRIGKDMGFIHTAADRMEALLNELLDMSRVGRITTPHESVTFQELVGEALDAVAGQITAGRVNIGVSTVNPALSGDRRRLLQIWQNLLDNALKYMGDQPEPRIEIGVEQQEGETVFYVSDNGIGIPPAYHEKVFGIFEKLDRTIGGVGMGLTMVKRIVEMYGGQIRVESQGDGTGCCFRFTLPQVLVPAEQATAITVQSRVESR